MQKALVFFFLFIVSLSGFAQDNKQAAKAAYQRAETGYMNKDYNGSIDDLKLVVSYIGSKDPLTIYLFIKNYYQLGSKDGSYWAKTDSCITVFMNVADEDKFDAKKYNEVFKMTGEVKKKLKEAKLNGDKDAKLKELKKRQLVVRIDSMNAVIQEMNSAIKSEKTIKTVLFVTTGLGAASEALLISKMSKIKKDISAQEALGKKRNTDQGLNNLYSQKNNTKGLEIFAGSLVGGSILALVFTSHVKRDIQRRDDLKRKKEGLENELKITGLKFTPWIIPNYYCGYSRSTFGFTMQFSF